MALVSAAGRARRLELMVLCRLATKMRHPPPTTTDFAAGAGIDSGFQGAWGQPLATGDAKLSARATETRRTAVLSVGPARRVCMRLGGEAGWLIFERISPDPRDLSGRSINAYNIAVTGGRVAPAGDLVRETARRGYGAWAATWRFRTCGARPHVGPAAAGREGEAPRGCTQVLLDTHDFQAPGFYQNHGYEIFGSFEGIGGRFSRHYLRKTLAAPPGSVGC